jgi:hypothetical protein
MKSFEVLYILPEKCELNQLQTLFLDLSQIVPITWKTKLLFGLYNIAKKPLKMKPMLGHVGRRWQSSGWGLG